MRDGRRASGRARGDRDHEPARDDAPLGARDGTAGRAARSSGRTGARPSAAASCRAELIRGADRARARPVLLGDEARVAARAHRARRASGARVRHRRLVARLEADRRPRARHRRDERVAHDAARPRLARLGRRAARALRRRPRRSCRGSSARPRSSARPTLLGVTLPIAGIAGDQQAALFGQAASSRGEAKATYGTGSFVLVERGRRARAARRPGLLETRRPRRGGYALEGAILASGAAIQWLRDGLGILADAAESEALARHGRVDRRRLLRPGVRRASARRTGTPDARGLISGITRGTTRAHLVRAALEAIAFQVADVLDAMPGRRRACCAPTAARARTAS